MSNDHHDYHDHDYMNRTIKAKTNEPEIDAETPWRKLKRIMNH